MGKYRNSLTRIGNPDKTIFLLKDMKNEECVWIKNNEELVSIIKSEESLGIRNTEEYVMKKEWMLCVDT